MHIRRLSGCNNFVSKWQKFVCNAIGYFQQVNRAQDGNDVKGFVSFNNSTSERVLDLLEAGYL